MKTIKLKAGDVVETLRGHAFKIAAVNDDGTVLATDSLLYDRAQIAKVYVPKEDLKKERRLPIIKVGDLVEAPGSRRVTRLIVQAVSPDGLVWGLDPDAPGGNSKACVQVNHIRTVVRRTFVGWRVRGATPGTWLTGINDPVPSGKPFPTGLTTARMCAAAARDRLRKCSVVKVYSKKTWTLEEGESK